MKTWLMRLKDVHGSYLNHDLRMKRSGVKVFTHLMLRGQVRSAVRFITDRVHDGGILSLDASTGVPGHSVLDICMRNIQSLESLMSQLLCHVMTSPFA